MSRVRALGASWPLSERDREARGPGTASDRAKGLEEDGAGPSVEEESVVFSNIRSGSSALGLQGLGIWR